jgi:hypothetical protein
MPPHEEHAMVGRVARIEARLDGLEVAFGQLSALWKTSVDDIKSTIRSEIADLKSEQIADLKRQVITLDQRLDGQNMLLSDVRTKQQGWEMSAGVVNWVIRALMGAAGLIAGYLGAKHAG